MKLYEITNAIRKIEELCDDQAELTQYLDSVDLQLMEKSENILKYERHLEMQSNAIDAEIKRLQDLKKIADNRIKNIKAYVQYAMESGGIKKIETPIGNLTLRKTESVEVTGELPAEYIKVKVTETPDKKAIKEALKKGETLNATIREYNSLIIK